MTVKIPVKQEDQTQNRFKRIDLLRVVSLLTAFNLIILNLNSRGNPVAWTHPLILAILSLYAVVFVTFLYIKSHAMEFYRTAQISFRESYNLLV